MNPESKFKNLTIVNCLSNDSKLQKEKKVKTLWLYIKLIIVEDINNWRVFAIFELIIITWIYSGYCNKSLFFFGFHAARFLVGLSSKSALGSSFPPFFGFRVLAWNPPIPTFLRSRYRFFRRIISPFSLTTTVKPSGASGAFPSANGRTMSPSFGADPDVKVPEKLIIKMLKWVTFIASY